MTPEIKTQAATSPDNRWTEVRAKLPMPLIAVMSDYAVFTRAQAEAFLVHLLASPEARHALGLTHEELLAARHCLVPQLHVPIIFGCCRVPTDPGGPPLIDRVTHTSKSLFDEVPDA